MANSNVLFCEPNWTHGYMSSNGGDEKLIELAPSLEDYCIVVDLEVEVPSRPIEGQVKSDSSTILLRYAARKDSKNAAVSFMQGKSNGTESFLSTDAMEFGTFSDIEQIDGTTTNEMFGINSINIAYDNYTVPIVTIEFTDIRGLSLFAVEEYRHNIVQNGLMGNQNVDLTGSFFKSFFTFPHPKFKLTVKGFYGQPVAYELYCTDFRANFNANTCNFGATAKFVGYRFSIINDLTLNSLIASPYSEYYGESYWESKVENGTFVLDDSSPMPKLGELVKKIDSIRAKIGKLSENEELKRLQDNQNNINHVMSQCELYASKVLEKIQGTKQSYKFGENGIILVVSGDYTNDLDYTVSKNWNLSTAYNDLVKAIKDYDGELLDLIAPYEENSLRNVHYKNYVNDKNYASSFTYVELQSSEVSEYQYVHEFNWVKLYERLQKDSNELASAIINKNQEIQEDKTATIYNTLGFYPTVENITNIILAHVDTFLHELKECANSVSAYIKNNEAKNSYRTENNSSLSPSEIMYAFPEVVEKKIINSTTQVEKTWVGSVDVDAPEVSLINSLLRATNKVHSIFQECENAELDEQENYPITNVVRDFNQGVAVPITPFDFLGYSEPYKGTNVSQIDEFCANVLLRASTILLSYNIDHTQNSMLLQCKEMGKLDALNFYKNVPIENLTSDFIQMLADGGTMTSDNILKLLLWDATSNREDSAFKDENMVPIWYQGETGYSENHLLSYYDYGLKNGAPIYVVNGFYKVPYFNNNEEYILPLSSINWQTHNVSNANRNADDVIVSRFNEKLFQIDRNWRLYTEYNAIREQCSVSKIDSTLDCAFDIKSYSKFYDSVLKKANIVSTNDKIKVSDMESVLQKALQDVPSFTISSFNGYDAKGKLTNEISLFGQKEFYSVPKEAQALLFLNSFNWDTKDFFSIFEQKYFTYMPYYFVLTVGGYLKRQRDGHEVMFGDSKDGFLSKLNTDIYKSLDGRGWFIFGGGGKEKLDKNFWDLFDTEVKNVFIQEFESWVNNGDFDKIYSTFNLECVLTSALTIENIVEYHKVGNLNNHPYDAISGSILYNKVDYVSSVVSEFSMPCMVIRGTDLYKWDATELHQFSTSAMQMYVKGFVQGLKDNCPNVLEDGDTLRSKDGSEFKTIGEVKVSLYYYLKRVWDKWLSGSGDESDGKIPWEYTKFKERWHYLDSYYNKIGNEASIDVLTLRKDILNSYKVGGYNALSLMSSTYGHSGFNLMCTQSFMSMLVQEKMNDMFKPIPYKEIDFSDIPSTPDFVVMYIYEPSSKLDLGDDQPGDSYMIGGEDIQLPEAIKNKTEDGGYKIPAFSVSVGKQYQSYFSDVTVNMENPQVTDHSLKAQFGIAELAQGGQEWTVVGSDLFTVWSNNSYTATVTMMGCAWVQPLMTFQLSNVPFFRGSYLIQKVNHSISQGQMTTTFTGTRMANFSTPYVKDGIVLSNNDQNGHQKPTTPYDQGRKAAIDNDCAYYYYNPLIEASDAGMPKEELSMFMFDYGVKYGGWKMTKAFLPSVEWQKSHTIGEFIGAIILGEASVLDTLGQKQVCGVIFNRCKAKGNLVKVLYNNVQHETRKWAQWDSLDKATKAKYTKIVEDIFINTPIVLVGEETYVSRSVPIWKNRVKTRRMSTPTTIDEHMVKSMNMYDTTKGYDTNYKNPRKKYNVGNNYEPLEDIPPESYIWHGGEYLFQHDNRNGKYGHVFVSSDYGGLAKAGVELWQTSSISNDSSSESPSKLCKNLFESIKKTCEFSEKVSLQNLKMEYSGKDVYDTIKITCTPTSGMAQVFDVVLNTYMQHVNELYWVVGNSGEEYPQYIQLTVGGESDKKTVAIARKNTSMNNGVSVIKQEEGLNDLFYISLKKHYNINYNWDNTELFAIECKNFTCIDSIDNDGNLLTWRDKVIKLFDKTIIQCGNDANSTRVDESSIAPFTWYGNNADSNKCEPIQIDSSAVNMAAVTKYLKDHCPNDKGNCAAYVRRALEACGLKINGSQPNSACRYSAHLPCWGFDLVYEGNVGGNNKDYQPQNGDIAVIAGITNAQEKDMHGHIHVYNSDDKGWYSDFKAKTIHVYASPKGRPYKVYRKRQPA